MNINNSFFYKSDSVVLNPSKIITCGIDVGSVSTKTVICVDGELYCFSIVKTRYSSANSAKNSLNIIELNTGVCISDCRYIVATGYGRVNIPFANKTITEISCHGKGANYIGGSTVRTVLDIGGQDCKVIHIDSSGRVTNFVMNDKCAAGTGRGIEIIAELLNVSLENVGPLSFDISEEPPSVSNICVVFARSEALSLLKKGWSKKQVLAVYMRAMAERISSLVMKIGLIPDLLITGGVSKNIGVVKRIEKILGINSLTPKIDTQIAGALGAGILAKELYEKSYKI